MKKEINKIIIFIAIYAIASSLLSNYQELWMAENNLSVKTISVVYSLCAFLTVSVIFLCSNLVDTHKMKKFISYLVYLRTFCILSLFLLNNTGLQVLIKFIIMLDYVISIEIETSFYPLIALSIMDNKMYAKKDIIYNGFSYLTILVSLILIGKKIGNISINYNVLLCISSILMILSSIPLKLYNPSGKPSEDKNNFEGMIKKVKKDKVLSVYLLYIVFNQLAYNIIAGIVITLLTSGLGISASSAVLVNVFAGVLSVIFGIVVLKFLTFKNEKINLFIKYGVRAILYLLSFLFQNKIICLIAILYTIFSSVAYTHITDGPYVNRLKKDLQFSFCNLKSMVTYFGKALGILLCGLTINLGVKYTFFWGSILAFIQLLIIYYAVDLRRKESHDRK